MTRYVLGPHAARAVKRLISGEGEISRRAVFDPQMFEESAFRDPFAVTWAQSVDSGTGAWVIWLPGSSLVIYDGTALDITTALNAAGGDYPAGWYKLASTVLPDSGGTLYLLITLPNGTTPASAALSASAGSSGQITIPVCVAAKDSTTGARSVRQYITSAVTMGGGAGGGGTQTVTAVTAIALREVSTGNYQLQVRTTPLTFTGTAGSESAWTTVFETVPHSNNPIV